MQLSFHPDAWQDYLYWQKTDKKILKRVNMLIKDILRNPVDGIGKPEPLRHDMAGCWSRRIDAEHRLVYCIRDETAVILQCRYHYH